MAILGEDMSTTGDEWYAEEEEDSDQRWCLLAANGLVFVLSRVLVGMRNGVIRRQNGDMVLPGLVMKGHADTPGTMRSP